MFMITASKIEILIRHLPGDSTALKGRPAVAPGNPPAGGAARGFDAGRASTRGDK